MKKIAVALLASILTLSMILSPVSAATQNEINDSISEETFNKLIKERHKQIKDLIKKSKKEEIESLLDEDSKKFDSKNYDKYLLWYYKKNNKSLFGVKGTEENPVDLNAYMEKGLKEGRFEEIQIDESTSVILTDGPIYFINERSVNPNKPVKSNKTSNEYTTLATYTTQYTYNKVVARNSIGVDKWTIYVGGVFEYNYKTVTPKIEVSYADSGSVTGWNVTSEKDGIWYSADKTGAEMWQQGYFKWTVAGITMDNEYAKVRIWCDSGGNWVALAPYITD